MLERMIELTIHRNKRVYIVNKQMWFFIVLVLFFFGELIRNSGMNGYVGDYANALSHSLSAIDNNRAGGFYFAGRVFRTINIFGFTSLSQWSRFLSIFFFPMVYSWCKKLKQVNLLQMIFISGFVVYFSFCVCNISKEAIQTLLFCLCDVIIFSDRIKTPILKCSIVTALLVISGIVFRQYFLISAIVFFVLCLVYVIEENYACSIKRDVVLFLVAVFLGMLIGKNFFPSLYNQVFNARTNLIEVYGNANTLIADVVNLGNSELNWIVNFLISSIRIMFPVEFVFKGMKYALFAIIQIILSVYVFGNYDKSYFWDIDYRMEYFLIVSFIIVELIWEIDLGTMFRHETTILLLLLRVFVLRAQLESKGFVENCGSFPN